MTPTPGFTTTGAQDNWIYKREQIAVRRLRSWARRARTIVVNWWNQIR